MKEEDGVNLKEAITNDKASRRQPPEVVLDVARHFRYELQVWGHSNRTQGAREQGTGLRVTGTGLRWYRNRTKGVQDEDSRGAVTGLMCAQEQGSGGTRA